MGSSSEAIEKAKLVGDILFDLGAAVTLWTDTRAFKPSEQTLSELIENAHIHNGAVFIFNPDDLAINSIEDETKKRKDKLIPRDNVLVETGIFAGILGRKSVAICKVDGVGEVSDLAGLVAIHYAETRYQEMKGKFKLWLAGIKDEDKVSMNRFPLNVHIGKKNLVEGRASIYDRLHGIKELTIVNFAATAFITGPLVDENYEGEGDELKRWFAEHLSSESDEDSIKVNVVLTNPGSYADKDASQYKMCLLQ